jgi:hypothetical protein
VSTLLTHEREALKRAGLDDTVISELDAVAGQTPWLAFRRWVWRPSVQISAAFTAFPAAMVASLLLGSWAATPVLMSVMVAPYLIEGVWRMATALLDPGGRGPRTAVAFSVRAKPDGQGGDGFAFAVLKDLAKAADGLSGAEGAAALNRYQRKKDRHQLITAAIILAVLAFILAMVMTPSLIA